MEEYNMADESLQNPVIDAVAHMVNLKTYEMTLTPLTSNILKTMDDTGVKLSDLFLFMVEEDDLDAQLKNLKLSKQREYISGLSIEWREESLDTDVFQLGSRTTNVDAQFTQLVSLFIHCTSSSHFVLVDILKNAPPSLESIQFDLIQFYDTSSDDEEQIANVIVPINSRMNELDLIIAGDYFAELDDWNNGFKAIIDACPHLEALKVDCDNFESKSVGALDLDFTNLVKLQKIDLNIHGFQYYTVNQANMQGRWWMDYSNTFDLDPSSNKSHINLSWSGNPFVKLGSLRSHFNKQQKGRRIFLGHMNIKFDWLENL